MWVFLQHGIGNVINQPTNWSLIISCHDMICAASSISDNRDFWWEWDVLHRRPEELFWFLVPVPNKTLQRFVFINGKLAFRLGIMYWLIPAYYKCCFILSYGLSVWRTQLVFLLLRSCIVNSLLYIYLSGGSNSHSHTQLQHINFVFSGFI